MKWSLILCIVGAAVALVCTCYGAISIYKIRKEERKRAKEERMTKHLYLSTGWLMLSDLYGIKVSSITSIKDCEKSFQVVFAKKSSDTISQLLACSAIIDALKGHFEKLTNGRYCFVNTSLSDAQHDVEMLIQYSNMLSKYSTELGGNECLKKYIP